MKVKGILSWAKVQPNNYDTFKGKKNWMVNVVPSEADAEKLIADGLWTAIAFSDGSRSGAKDTKRKNQDGVWEFRFKRKVELQSGVTKTPPVIVGKDGKTPINEPIGNGSVGWVQYTTYEYEGNKYIDLQGIQIIELVPYDGGLPDGAEFEDLSDGDDTEAVVEDAAPESAEENPFV